jgi:serine protease
MAFLFPDYEEFLIGEGPMLNNRNLLCCLSLFLTAFVSVISGSDDSLDDVLDQVGVPVGMLSAPSGDPIVVAIVDDGFRLTHQDIVPFLWENPAEIPGNRRDDDGNGHVDDIFGWDLADNDADVSHPENRESEFYHGTHVAGIVTRLARRVYGEKAPEFIKILPVKAIADDAKKMSMELGYDGIQYAADLGADVILAAWSSHRCSSRESRILDAAVSSGSIIIGAAGNAYSNDPMYPAAHESVWSVAAVDNSGIKLKNSSFGGTVDFVAPGKGISSASVLSDDGYASHGGTSYSAALVAGMVAVMKKQAPDLSVVELRAKLKNTAEPVDLLQGGEIVYSGKLGAGRINLERAIEYQLSGQPAQANNLIEDSQGYLVRYSNNRSLTAWKLRPPVGGKGTWLSPRRLHGDAGDARLQIHLLGDESEVPFLDIPISEWSDRVYIPEQAATILLLDDPDAEYQFLAEYALDPVDQSTLFCEGVKELKQEGLIEDGSGDLDYSPQSDCKWLITAPAGKAIHIEFLEFDTQANSDWLYFFNGSGTHERVMAVYSGPNIPPELTTWSNQVLIWFVTDDAVQGGGWKASVTFVEPINLPE